LRQSLKRVRSAFDARTAARDRALSQARTLTRFCANAIRAVHRDEGSSAQQFLDEARLLAESLRSDLTGFPDLYYAGYTQDALKEYAEASIVHALIGGNPLPSPEELGLEHATYLQGLADMAGTLAAVA
jgi:translin